MKLFKDYKINECNCSRNCCDEFEFSIDCEFYLAKPEKFTLFGKDYTIDRICIEPTFCGLNTGTEIVDCCCVKFETDNNLKFDCIEIPKEFIKEMAVIFKKLEQKKDKRLNDCIISDDFYNYLWELEAK